MLLFPNALCCSLYERKCVWTVTKIFTKFLPANNFCQLLRVTRKCSCTSANNVQAQLHFRDDQQRAFGISNISNCMVLCDLLVIGCVMSDAYIHKMSVPTRCRGCREKGWQPLLMWHFFLDCITCAWTYHNTQQNSYSISVPY